MDLRNEDASMFGLKQAPSPSPRGRMRQPAEGFTTRPIGPVADQLLAKLVQTNAREFLAEYVRKLRNAAVHGS
jgi:hypothetical protein